jgi:hypothetical protein
MKIPVILMEKRIEALDAFAPAVPIHDYDRNASFGN